MVAYAPTEDAAEGEKVKYMAALNSTVEPVPVREHVFVLTDANATTGEEREAGKQTARCWALMAETCSTKTASTYWVSQKTTNLLF